MAYTDPRQLLSQVRQPGSLLQPKPGVVQAGGNAPTPVLSQQEQQAPSTSFQAPATAKPSAPAVPTQAPDPVVPQYQQAVAQNPQFAQPQTGFLSPAQATAGQYSGYTSQSSSTGNANILKQIPQGPATAWTPEQWKQAYDESQGNPFLAGTVSAQGIQKIYNDYISKGLTPDEFAIGTNMGGMYLPSFKPSTIGSVKLEPGEQQTAQGVSKMLSSPGQSSPGQAPSFDKAAGLTPKGSEGKPQAQPQLGGFTPGNAAITVPEKLPPSLGGLGGQQVQAQSGGQDEGLGKIFKFFKGELERERDSQLSEADADAARRGVFYGTPGTQSREDVRDKFGRSLSQLEANLLQNESQNELSRLGLATNLFGLLQQGELGRAGLMSDLIPQDMESSGGLDPAIFEALGGMFGGQAQAGGVTQSAQKVPTVQPVSVQTPMKSSLGNKAQTYINKYFK